MESSMKDFFSCSKSYRQILEKCTLPQSSCRGGDRQEDTMVFDLEDEVTDFPGIGMFSNPSVLPVGRELPPATEESSFMIWGPIPPAIEARKLPPTTEARKLPPATEARKLPPATEARKLPSATEARKRQRTEFLNLTDLPDESVLRLRGGGSIIVRTRV
jgi:hypothetical protein